MGEYNVVKTEQGGAREVIGGSLDVIRRKIELSPVALLNLLESTKPLYWPS